MLSMHHRSSHCESHGGDQGGRLCDQDLAALVLKDQMRCHVRAQMSCTNTRGWTTANAMSVRHEMAVLALQYLVLVRATDLGI